MILKIGERYPADYKKSDAVIFDMTDSGAVLVFTMQDPTKDEINQFKSGTKFQIKEGILMNDVITFAVKVGNLPWSDVPFNPHLSRFSVPEITDNSSGLALQITLLDTPSGIVKGLRLIGLGNEFSKRFISDVDKVMKLPFEKNAYYSNVAKMFSKYQTNDIVGILENHYQNML